MKKGKRVRRLMILLTILMAGASMSGCTPKVIKDVAMELYEDKVKGGSSDKDEDGKEDQEEDLEAGDHGDGAADGDSTEQKDGSDGADAADSPGGSEAGSGAGAGTFAQYIKEELEPMYGKGDNTSFSYGYEEISYTDTDYWFASPKTAALEDGIIATCQRDLDKDGFDELLLLYTAGSKGSGNGQNRIGLKVYSEKDGAVTEVGGLEHIDCFSGYNSEEYMIGLKDLGDKRLIYTQSDREVYTWADGGSPEIRLYQYDGSSLKETYQVATTGSDDSWWEGWKNDLRAAGFVLPACTESWSSVELTGEPGFEVLAYGECVTNEPQTGQYTDMQQWMLANGRIEGGIYGPGSDIVKRLNQGMTSYAGGGYAGSGGGGASGSYAGGGGSMTGGGYAGGSGSGVSGGYASSDYILPESSTRYLTRQDLAGLTKEQLRLARNEIYARHGRKFQTQDYFNSKSWYVGTIEPKNFREEYLNIYEKENVKLIQSLED